MKKIYVFLFLILLLSVFTVKSKSGLLNGKIIYLDAGHGGIDGGSKYKDINEDDINLSIVMTLKEEMEKEGAKVYLTRNGDYDLASTTYYRKKSDLGNRATMINNSDCDLYLSIHLNSSLNSTWNGAQVFYDDVNSKNKYLAEALQKELGNKKTVLAHNYYMYSRIKKPGVLLELGFISNYNDRNNLQNKEYQIKISANIIKGIVKFFRNNY